MVSEYAVGVFQGVFHVKALFGDCNVVHKTRNCIRYHVQTPRSIPDIQIELGTVLGSPYQAKIKFIRGRRAQARLFSNLDCGGVVSLNDSIVLKVKDHVTDFLDSPDQTGDFQFCGPISSFRAGKDFTQKEYRFDTLAVTFNGMIERAVVIILHIVNHDAEAALRRVKVDI